ncbi:hypothetical protein U14_00687 [Candidatus Moduliflexus flocculans]|uniref:Surface carbohydrate biosynthesis protein n=1 Tax=Candidatus Moduliflexus flocculans TaxID=1499966 RepID=A0A0S6VV26_9BACT|nr:hypothetical protein U14_00687 [Candidatus Moduliflexus flocculans]
MNTPRLYLGIEIKVREFDATMLLACVAAEAGFDVIIGQQRLFKQRLEEMRPGIYLDKSVTAKKTAPHASLRKSGFHIVAYDAEGLAFFDAEEYQKRRLAPETLSQLDYFFAWGEYHANVVREKMLGHEQSIIPVGHPRIDLTRRELRPFYAEEAEALRKKYGRFLLINTNFSLCNHVRGKDVAIDVLAKGGKIADETHRTYYFALREHKRKIFDAFIEMIRSVHQHFPEMPIVIRPHPIEDHDYYRQILPSDANLHVIHEGNVLPWLMAAQATIHNSCTTGIEAYLLERPVIAYQPIQAEEFDIYLPNVLSQRVFSLVSLLECLPQYFNQEKEVRREDDEEKRNIAAFYLSGLTDQLACDRIVEALTQILPIRNSWSVISYRFSRMARRAARNIFKTKAFDAPSAEFTQDKVRQQVFSGITLTEANDILERFQKLTGRFSSVRIIQIDEDLFRLSSIHH